MSKMKVNRIENTSTASGGLDVDTSGKVRITTLADSSGNNNSTPAEIASGRAKAWVNFNGVGTVAILASYNVSSVTDLGTGKYQVNFTNAVAAGCCPVMFNSAYTTTSFTAFDNQWTGGMTIGTTQIQVSSFNGGFVDSSQFFVVVFGD